MTMNSTEAMILIEAARKNNSLFMEAFMYRVHPQTEKIREIIKDYFLDEPLEIEASFGFKADVPKEHRLVNRELGGGSILDIGCYPMSMSRMVVGIQEGKSFNYIRKANKQNHMHPHVKQSCTKASQPF